MINNCIKFILNWIIPYRCVICKQFQHDNANFIEHEPIICKKCISIMPYLQTGCAQCNLPIKSGELCGKCLTNTIYFDITYSPYAYTFPIDKMIHQLKYAGKIDLIKPLASMMASHIQQYHDKANLPELLIAVPSHPSRLRQRGFNQSLELTKHISKLLKINYLKQAIVKTKSSPPQASLSLKKRHSAIRNSFKINHKITARHVAIIDDVMTTGATASELARTLKHNGVEYVEIWCLARA